ncbi:MAG: hypothetical protein OYG31_02460 [Candidatus Kaiserbacteria bacterium]|nr:hypothetical protein [Candidatus Kaiserbacteria bacterium]
MRRKNAATKTRLWFSRHENRRLVVTALRGAGWFFLSVAVLWGTVHLPVISVNSVHIDDRTLTDQDLRSEVFSFVTDLLEGYAYGVKGSTRYFFKRDEVAAMVAERFPGIGSVTITRKFFNRWVITSSGRTTFGTVCSRGDCYLIDPYGIVFDQTTLPAGTAITIDGDIRVGETLFGKSGDEKADFSKVVGTVQFLDSIDVAVDEVALKRDSRVVRIRLAGGIGVVIDASESLYDTTRALYVVFREVFSHPRRQGVVSVDVRNPLSILYEKQQ